MGACRENQSIWHWLFGKYRRPHIFFKRKMWRGEYFWHDSFGRYLNRWFVCSFFGHRKLQYLADGGCSCDDPVWHCFACEKSFKDKPAQQTSMEKEGEE